MGRTKRANKSWTRYLVKLWTGSQEVLREDKAVNSGI